MDVALLLEFFFLVFFSFVSTKHTFASSQNDFTKRTPTFHFVVCIGYSKTKVEDAEGGDNSPADDAK